MKSLQIIEQLPIPIDCHIKYRGMAFDGSILYFTQPASCKICGYDLSLKPIGATSTFRGYSVLCYDTYSRCFWASSDEYKNKIFKLDCFFKEIDYLTIGGKNDPRLIITGIAALEETLLISRSDEIMEVCKSSGQKRRVLHKCQSCAYHALTSCKHYYGYSYEKCGSDCMCISKLDGTTILKCCLEEDYSICDMAVVECGGNCDIYAFTMKKRCYPQLIKFRIFSMDNDLDFCEEDCCTKEKQRPEHYPHHDDCNCYYDTNCGYEEECCSCEIEGDCCSSSCNEEGCDFCLSRDCKFECQNILESIALIETALSCILNAEGEKIQKALKSTDRICDMLEINKSVIKAIAHVTHLEHILYSKLQLVREICPNICEPCNEPCEEPCKKHCNEHYEEPCQKHCNEHYNEPCHKHCNDDFNSHCSCNEEYHC